MCGITGYFSPVAQDIDKWLDGISHRGPDDRGSIKFPGGEVGMVRLSILGLDEGVQPFCDKQSKHILVFNGEIFNFEDLRIYLNQTYSLNLNTRSDTEVLFHGLKCEYSKFLARLDGMFSLCFIDLSNKRAFLAVDKTGIKGLKLRRSKDSIMFSSEGSNEFCDFQFNGQGVTDFLNFGFTSKYSINGNLEKLTGGQILNIDLTDNSAILSSYLPLNNSINTLFRYSENSISKFSAKDLREKIIEGVNDWSVSDVPISLSLSSGIDSSIIAICLAEMGKQADIECLTIDVEGSPVSETSRSKKLVDYYGLKQRTKVLKKQEFFDELPLIIGSLDEPYFGSFISWWVYKMASEKVVLTGTGADELFGNYNKKMYARSLLHSLKNHLFGKVKSFSNLSITDKAFCYTPFFGMGSLSCCAKREASSVHESYQRMGRKWSEFIANYDIGFQLQHEFLYISDRFSMLNGVEARTPFLSKSILDYIQRQNHSDLLAFPHYKGVLLEAFPELNNLRSENLKLGFTDGNGWVKEFLNSYCEKKPHVLFKSKRLGMNSKKLLQYYGLRNHQPKNVSVPLMLAVWGDLRGYLAK